MSAELIAIFATGIALAGLILTVTGRLSTRLTAVEKETARVAGAVDILTEFLIDRERSATGGMTMTETTSGKVEIVHPSYRPNKEDMRVDAAFEEAVDTLTRLFAFSISIGRGAANSRAVAEPSALSHVVLPRLAPVGASHDAGGRSGKGRRTAANPRPRRSGRRALPGSPGRTG